MPANYILIIYNILIYYIYIYPCSKFRFPGEYVTLNENIILGHRQNIFCMDLSAKKHKETMQRIAKAKPEIQGFQTRALLAQAKGLTSCRWIPIKQKRGPHLGPSGYLSGLVDLIQAEKERRKREP